MTQVWKSESTEFYTYQTKSRGDHAGKRKVTSWSANINGRVVEGFSTKHAALAAILKAQS